MLVMLNILSKASYISVNFDIGDTGPKFGCVVPNEIETIGTSTGFSIFGGA
jgi:hypothetical protein